MAKELKKRGFRFVGPTTGYSLMQAAGIVNDHAEGCCGRGAAEAEQLRGGGAPRLTAGRAAWPANSRVSPASAPTSAKTAIHRVPPF